jgi:hypothetical protein
MPEELPYDGLPSQLLRISLAQDLDPNIMNIQTYASYGARRVVVHATLLQCDNLHAVARLVNVGMTCSVQRGRRGLKVVDHLKAAREASSPPANPSQASYALPMNLKIRLLDRQGLQHLVCGGLFSHM